MEQDIFQQFNKNIKLNKNQNYWILMNIS